MSQVYICRGKDCRKHAGTRKLVALIEGAGLSWTPVRCQKICKAPVAGVVLNGTLEWFSKVRGKKTRRALLKAATKGKLGSIRTHREKKRSGRLR